MDHHMKFLRPSISYAEGDSRYFFEANVENILLREGTLRHPVKDFNQQDYPLIPLLEDLTAYSIYTISSFST